MTADDSLTGEQIIDEIRAEKGEEYVEQHRVRIEAELRLLGYSDNR